MSSWDENVALAFAAEELLFAAQAITSDSITREQGFGMAHWRVHNLTQHNRSFPADLALRIDGLDASYTDRERSGATDTVSAIALVAATLDLLSDVQTRLHDAQQL